MNTNFKLDRQVVLTLCVLLTAMWLPLTTFAQVVPKTGNPAQGANPQADKCVHCLSMHNSMDVRDCQHLNDSLAFLQGSRNGTAERGVGFAETDPTVRYSLDIPAISQPAVTLMAQSFVGFAETDPANQPPVYGLTVSKTPTDRIQQSFVGFAETDPADNTYRPAVENHTQHLVVCPHENVKSVVYGAPAFPGLSGERHCHESS